MKTLGLFVALVALMGCGTLESAAKGTFDIAWDAAEKVVAAKIPVLEGKILDAAKEAADKALQAACDYTREKTADASEALLAKIEKQTTVPVSNYDADKSGLLEINELKAYLRGLLEEQNRRKDAGEEPIPWYVYLLAAGVAPPAYGLLNSAIKRGQYFRIEEKVREMTGVGVPEKPAGKTKA